GKETTSPRYHAKIYNSSVELPGALETFLWFFFNNGLKDYYYWYSYVDEVKSPGGLKDLKERYKRICDEVKRLYPNGKASYRYNDENYFSLQLNENCEMEISYFGSDEIHQVTLVVIASYPKS
ncbi:MAG: hypothetical protein KDB79_11595, partial [Acidobacteria bacterium]|nr:hypothetical protein [Acidobacteriota bacterium]